MNSIKYKILVIVDNSNEPIDYYDLARIIQKRESIDINVFQKHFNDLTLQKMLETTCGSNSNYIVTHIGRDYIDRYDETQLHNDMYREQINDAKHQSSNAEKIAHRSDRIAIAALIASTSISLLGIVLQYLQTLSPLP